MFVCGVAMTQEEAFSPTSEVSEDKLDEVANSAKENMSNWARVCPSCGAYSPKYMESCTECGFTQSLRTIKKVNRSSTFRQDPAIEQKANAIFPKTPYRQRKDIREMVECPMCNGTGKIFLEYLDEYDSLDGNQEDRWLQCADCDGSGKIPKDVIIDRKNKTLMKHLLEVLSGFLP